MRQSDNGLQFTFCVQSKSIGKTSNAIENAIKSLSKVEKGKQRIQKINNFYIDAVVMHMQQNQF
jgi:hypothetical protein